MGLARVFGVCAALLFASSVGAANIIDLGPSDYKNWGSGSFQHRPGGINGKFGQTVRMPPMNTNLTVTRNAVIPYGSVANGLKNFVRITPGSALASAAVTGLFLAVDWVFDQSTGEWMREDDSYYYDDLDFNMWCVAGTCGPTPDEACQWLTINNPTNTNAQYSGQYIMNPNGTASCINNFGQSTITANRELSCPQDFRYDPSTGRCLGDPRLIPLTDSDFQELGEYLPSADPNQVGGAASDAQRRTGAPLPGYTDMQMEGPSATVGPESTTTTTTSTGDSVVTSTTTTTNYNYGDTTITTTNTTTSTTYTNGTETSTETTTEAPGELPVTGGGGATEWPGFCDWATVVCDWLNWTQEEPPPDEDLPLPIDGDFYEEKRISFGAKSCPPDHQINLAPFLPTTVGVSFQPLCDFAGLIYYMVMAASYIIAAYITIGVARNG